MIGSSSPTVSIRSTLSDKSIVTTAKRINVVKLKSGDLVDPSILSLGQRFLNRNCYHYSISGDQQTLVFRGRLQVNGWNVDYKLGMKVCLDSHGVGNFIRAFYSNPEIDHVTTGLVLKALTRAVNDEVLKNLRYVDVKRVNGPVKSATRHNNLVAACIKVGLHNFTDELTLERVS